MQNPIQMLKHITLKTKSHKKLVFNVKTSLYFIFGSIFLISCKNQPKEIINNKEHIEVLMQEQEDAWNEGNLESFMKHYWNSDSLRFIGKSGLNKGWQKTLKNYKKSYKSKEEMGTLKFNNKNIEILEEETIFVIGEWYLKRQDSLGDLKGMYSLIWQKKNDNWVITTDHSS